MCEKCLYPELFWFAFSRIQNAVICRNFISIGLRCRSNNESKFFIFGIVYSSEINTVLIQRLNRALYDECRQNDFKYVSNGAVTENDLWIDWIYLQESGKRIIANNLMQIQNVTLRAVWGISLKRSPLTQLRLL